MASISSSYNRQRVDVISRGWFWQNVCLTQQRYSEFIFKSLTVQSSLRYRCQCVIVWWWLVNVPAGWSTEAASDLRSWRQWRRLQRLACRPARSAYQAVDPFLELAPWPGTWYCSSSVSLSYLAGPVLYWRHQPQVKVPTWSPAGPLCLLALKKSLSAAAPGCYISRTASAHMYKRLYVSAATTINYQ